MAWWSSKKKKGSGVSYFAPGVTLEGRLCFHGIIRLDGRVIGEIVSSGTLVVEETAVITGDILVENIILSGTVYGDIRAFRQVQLNSTAKVYGHISYGELSIEGAIHEGSSHKLSASEINEVQQECADILQETETDLEKSRPSPDALAQYATALDNADREASVILGKKPAKKRPPAPRPASPGDKTPETDSQPSRAGDSQAKGG